MQPCLLFLIAVLPSADVNLSDLKQFHNAMRLDTEARMKAANAFHNFTVRHAPGERDGALDRAATYQILCNVNDPNLTLQERLTYLRLLRKYLGTEDYARGRVPPPFPEKYRKPFRRWLKENGSPPYAD